MNNRAQLLRTIFEQGFRTPDWRHKQPPPVVTLEQFFDGNTDPNSIAVNLDDHPGTGFFYAHLKAIRSDPLVHAVLVNIYDLHAAIEGGWPCAENVHILTSAEEDQVQAWAQQLRSDGAFEGWPYGQAEVAPQAGPGMRWWSIAWD